MEKTYINDIGHDEIRSGFLVTTDRKKIWNKKIELLLEVDRICRKSDIPYFAIDSTMLGCARHKGFIPWDDNLKVAMLRPDYMRFVQVAVQELKFPYFLQNTYTDNRIMNWSKIMDDSTSAIEDWDADMHQGIFVDIFPLDAVPDGTERACIIDEMMKELWMCVITPQQVADGLESGANTHVASQTLKRIIDMPLAERMNIYEDFCVKHFDDSSEVCSHMLYWINRSKPMLKEWFNDIDYIDFEGIQIPVPANQDAVLTKLYGEWSQPKHSSTLHEGIFMTPDIPFTVAKSQINRDLLLCGEYLWNS